MEKFIAATPRPWRFDFSDMNFYNEIGTSILTIHRRPKIVGQDDIERSGLSIETKRNAELVEVAVNNYDDLSKFLRMVNDCLNDGIPIEKNDPIHNIAKQLLESLK